MMKIYYIVLSQAEIGPFQYKGCGKACVSALQWVKASWTSAGSRRWSGESAGIAHGRVTKRAVSSGSPRPHKEGRNQLRRCQRKIVFNLHISRAGCVNPLRREQDVARSQASGLLTSTGLSESGVRIMQEMRGHSLRTRSDEHGIPLR
jgi:hypothetical protein